jgi:hypothetical protein
MDFEFETLKKIAKRVGDNATFKLEPKEVPFALMGAGRSWLEQVDQKSGLYKFTAAGLRTLGKQK